MNRLEAHQAYAAAKTGADLRALALADLFFLLVHVFKRSDADHDFIYARCREVEAAPDGRLDLWAREHYKSTIITFALTIQCILRNPELTVGIFSHTRPIAKAFLNQIRRELEDNTLLHELFPDVLWGPGAKGAVRWSEDGGLCLKRGGNPKEATLEAWGLVDGQPTGKHFDLLVYDDVVTLGSVTTPAMIKKVTDAWALSLNLGAHGGAVRYIGTRYRFNDTYDEIIKRGAAIPRVHPATLNGQEDGEPAFLSPEELARKRREMGPYIFGCQMLQNPKADAVMGFKREWFQVVTEKSGEKARRAANTYIVVDPAGEKKKENDYTTMWVVSLGADQNYYVIDGVRDRLNLTERAARLFGLHRKHRPLAVGYEKYGMQADIEHMRFRMDQEMYHFNLIPLGGPVPKNDRIRRLIPLFEGGRIFFPHRLLYLDGEGRTRDLTAEFLEEEFLAFPVAGHDDMLDCLARIVEPDLGACFPNPDLENMAGTSIQQSSIWD